MVGAVIILIVLFLAGPVAVMVGGAVWSALFGTLVGAEADKATDGQPA